MNGERILKSLKHTRDLQISLICCADKLAGIGISSIDTFFYIIQALPLVLIDI